MFFNLIPVHPLDGSKILSALLPIDVAVQYDRFVGQYGQCCSACAVERSRRVLFDVCRPLSGGRYSGAGDRDRYVEQFPCFCRSDGLLRRLITGNVTF